MTLPAAGRKDEAGRCFARRITTRTEDPEACLRDLASDALARIG